AGPVGKLGSQGEESEETQEIAPASVADDRTGRLALSGLDANPEELDQGGSAARLQDARGPCTDRGRGVPALPQATPDADVPGAARPRGRPGRRRRAAGRGDARGVPHAPLAG